MGKHPRSILARSRASRTIELVLEHPLGSQARITGIQYRGGSDKIISTAAPTPTRCVREARVSRATQLHLQAVHSGATIRRRRGRGACVGQQRWRGGTRWNDDLHVRRLPSEYPPYAVWVAYCDAVVGGRGGGGFSDGVSDLQELHSVVEFPRDSSGSRGRRSSRLAATALSALPRGLGTGRGVL